MYNKMLVLLDGSKIAENVFSYAQGLAARLHINLDLLHVCNHHETQQLPMRQAYMEHIAENLQEKIADMRAKAGLPQAEAIKAEAKVLVGDPAEEILNYAHGNNIDLIMLSTHGGSESKRWGLGSVANKVTHGAEVPVWLVPSEVRGDIVDDNMPNRGMVIPLDGSKEAESVIPHAIAIAKQRGAEADIVLLHVAKVATPLFYDTEQTRQMEAAEARMKQYLDGVAKTINEDGIKVHTEVLAGVPAESLINYVKDHPVNLIAMATHGHAAIHRAIFGTVTESILHLVKKTPILIVRPPED